MVRATGQLQGFDYMLIKNKLSYSLVKEWFDYNNDGSLTRKFNNKSKKEKAGYVERDGYIRLSIQGKLFPIHRVVWLWHYGYWPENLIDHIDRDKSNNKIENLREATPTCNVRNSKVYKHNTSGVRGVYKDKTKWGSQIKVSGKKTYLGSYDDFDEAVLARLAAEQCLNWSSCDSNSSAYKHAIENKLIIK